MLRIERFRVLWTNKVTAGFSIKIKTDIIKIGKVSGKPDIKPGLLNKKSRFVYFTNLLNPHRLRKNILKLHIQIIIIPRKIGNLRDWIDKHIIKVIQRIN